MQQSNGPASITPNGGTAVVEALVAEGVEVVFGIPGTHNLELYRALAESGIRHVVARSEQGAGYAADGYARATGRPGVCFVTSGPAVNNIAAPVGTAHADSIPLLVIAPGPPRGMEGADRGDLHEMRDQRGHMAGVAERAVRVSSPAEAAAAVHETFARWRDHRQRPAYVEVPLDVLGESWDGDRSAAVVPAPPESGTLDVHQADLGSAVQHLASARRPALLAGRGAVPAAKELRDLAELLDAPVVTTVNGKGVLPESHPLSLGASVRLTPAQQLLGDSDVVLCVGTGLSDAELWGWKPDFGGVTIRVDIDPAQLTNNLTPDFCVTGDSAAVLHHLTAEVRQRRSGPADHQGAARAEHARTACLAAAATKAGPWAELNAVLARALPPETIIAGDSSQVTYYGTSHFWPAEEPFRLLYPTIYATLGYGLPAAIGAKVGRPDLPVVAMVGDGAAMFSIAELATATQEHLGLPFIVINDHGYTEIRDGMLQLGIRPVAVDLLTPDFAALGVAISGRGVHVSSLEQLVGAVLLALEDDRPTVIEVDARALLDEFSRRSTHQDEVGK